MAVWGAWAVRGSAMSWGTQLVGSLSARSSQLQCLHLRSWSLILQKERVEGKPLLRKHVCRSCLHHLCPISPPASPEAVESVGPQGRREEEMLGILLAYATQYQVDLAKHQFTVTLSGEWSGLSITDGAVFFRL